MDNGPFDAQSQLGEGAPAEAAPVRGLEVVEDDSATVWGLWRHAFAELESDASVPRWLDARGSFHWPSPLPTTAGHDDAKAQAEAMALLLQRHPRVVETIHRLWGDRECSVVMNRLIMAGGEVQGLVPDSFAPDTLQALATLVEVHDAAFGPPDTLWGGI